MDGGAGGKGGFGQVKPGVTSVWAGNNKRLPGNRQSGAVAQGEARLIWDQEAAGSRPVCSTRAKAGIGAPAGRRLPLGLHRECAGTMDSFRNIEAGSGAPAG